MKLPTGRGLWPAFWMLGNDCSGGAAIWPACGEIDVMENIGSQPRVNTSTIWGPTTPPQPNGYSVERGVTLSPGKDLSKDYHLYALEWEPNVVRFYLDNSLYGTITPIDLAGNDMWVLNHPFFMLLNIAVGGDNPGPVGKHTVFPQRLYVDYVRVYSKNACGTTSGDSGRSVKPVSASESAVGTQKSLNVAGPSALTNIAPSGSGYTWHTMSSPTATSNQAASTIINDGNLKVGVNVDVAGEPSQNKYEAGGVTFTTAQSGITKVDFANGAIDGNGNGFFEANMALQTHNGTSWSNVPGWTLSPAYPYTTAAGGVTYTFTGPALNSVRGVRIVGEVRVTGQDNSWSWIVNEVEVWANQTSTDFTLTATPASRTVMAGGGTTYTATAAPLNGFTGAVALSISGLPAGTTGSFNPPSIPGGTGNSTLTISTSGTTPVGSYTLTLTGTNGNLIHSATVTLVVGSVSGGDFSLAVSPSQQTVVAGNGTAFTGTINPLSGFTGTVNLAVTGLPSGATGALNPASIAGGSGSSTLTITTTGTTAAGWYNLTISGASGTLSHSANVTLVVNPVGASPTNWKGHNWVLTTGGMAGVLQGNPANISVDANGYLHQTITKRGSTYTASEMFTQDNLGFGTYQYQIEGAVDNMDKNTVFGLFPYGPEAGIGVDGENELDIEFSKWNFDPNACAVTPSCNLDFTFYPSTGNKAKGPTQNDYIVHLNGGTLVTARLVWTSTSVTGTVMTGLQPIGTTANVLATWTFAPSNNTQLIPQVAVPLGINFWAFQAAPTSNQSVIIRDFQFVHQ